MDDPTAANGAATNGAADARPSRAWVPRLVLAVVWAAIGLVYIGDNPWLGWTLFVLAAGALVSAAWMFGRRRRAA